MLCAAASIFLYNSPQYHARATSPSLYDLQHPSSGILGTLRRPSQFPGLENIERPHIATGREIINFPIVVGRVDEANSRTVITGGPDSHVQRQGLEARKVEVWGSVSAIHVNICHFTLFTL